MIPWLIDEYMSQKCITPTQFAKKLGFHYKTVEGWLYRRHHPSKFSSQCLLDLFIKEIPEENKMEYKTIYWEIYDKDKLFLNYKRNSKR